MGGWKVFKVSGGSQPFHQRKGDFLGERGVYGALWTTLWHFLGLETSSRPFPKHVTPLYFYWFTYFLKRFDDFLVFLFSKMLHCFFSFRFSVFLLKLEWHVYFPDFTNIQISHKREIIGSSYSHKLNF